MVASAASTWRLSRTSVTTLSPPTSAAAASHVSECCSQIATLAPNAAKPLAIPRPIPEPPPVTTATRPSSRAAFTSIAIGETLRSAPVKKLLVTLTALALILGACGSDSDDDKASTTETTKKSESSSGSGDLESKLLSASDLPTGFSQTSDDSDDESETPEDEESEDQFCKELNDFDKNYKADNEEQRDFQKGEPGPEGGAFLTESLEEYNEASKAEDAMNAFKDAMSKCKTFETAVDDSDPSAGTMKGSFSALSFPKLGDDTFASHMSATQSAAGIEVVLGGDFVAVRKSKIVVLIFGLAFGKTTITTEQLEGIARKAVAKV